MKRVMTGVVAAALMVPALTACGGSDDFCEAAPQDIDTSDPAAMQEALEGIADQAPDEVRDDVDVIIEQLRLVEEDPASIDVDAVNTAVENLTTWEEENC
ncbi:hypothetical protein MWU75_18530 [Ornithinimicrobium sp. F0845]|uniref:hypothetical protein n=1 Tax=Ornithinimicrobium sp. F0845 TaxID=2926412 RepID=UPI001FF3D860|nr:hypothetical protein [Ornithinimicrobium sp. F0845]MCK0114139.1 hypothetical protein [Ornithinimicrobium sp. F0845]